MDCANSCACRTRWLCHLFNVGCFSRTEFLSRWRQPTRRPTTSLAVLFASALGPARNSFRSRMAWRTSCVVACMAALFSSTLDLAISRWISIHLLLLQRRVLQGFLGRPSKLHSRRACVPRRKLSRRTKVPAGLSEHPPILSLCRNLVHRTSLLGCLCKFLALQLRWNDWLWNQRWNNCACNESNLSFAVHIRMSLPTTSCRRKARLPFVQQEQTLNIQPSFMAQSTTHALRVDQSLRRCFHRYLCANVREWNLD